jgi:predicted MFS family arabinose efflux permease
MPVGARFCGHVLNWSIHNIIHSNRGRFPVPRAAYVLALGIFAMVTSEFVVAGLMPQMADGLNATVPQIGFLITAFAVAMAAGGPFLTVAVMRLPPRTALMTLFGVFLAGNVLAATATGYSTMLAARVVTGIASQAFFGVGISLCAQLTRPEVRGRAIAVAMNGLMLGTLLGLPLSTLIGERFGWRAAFWAISALTLVAAAATLVGVPRLGRAEGGGGFRAELGVFRRPRLWLVLSTSTLIIGATFSAFSYLNPILTGLTGFSAGTVPFLLIAYGAATVVGNTVVGRLADRHTLPVLAVGLLLNLLFLTGFALFADLPAPALICMLGIGLVGVTMNPAMVTRVQRTGNAGPLVNTVHSSFITLGVILGSSLGAVAIGAWGLRSPLWIGAGLALLGLGTLLPDLSRRGGRSGKPVGPAPRRRPAARRPVHVPSAK